MTSMLRRGTRALVSVAMVVALLPGMSTGVDAGATHAIRTDAPPADPGPGSVTGHVTYLGAGVAGVELEACTAPGVCGVGYTYTDTAGAYSILLAPGDYLMEAAPPNFEKYIPMGSVTIGSDAVTLDLALTGVSISGKLTDSTGSPYSYGLVELCPTINPPAAPDGCLQGAVAAADGSYVIRYVAPGDWTLRAYFPPNYQPIDFPVTVASGDLLRDIAIVSVSGDGTASTGPDATSANPIAATVTNPAGGAITITEGGAPFNTGQYVFLGNTLTISAANTASAASPIVISFTVDASLLSAVDVSTISVLRDGTPASDCIGATTAVPDPCVASRAIVSGGDAQISVLTTHASLWDIVGHAPVGTALTTRAQAMDGDLKVRPGSILKVGYDFAMPGRHAAATIKFLRGTVTFNATCVSRPGGGVIAVSLADASYAVPRTSSTWYPSGAQNAPSTYQGSAVIPNLCGGGLVRLRLGGTFTTHVTSTDTADKVNVRWHYADGAGGDWSRTYTVVPR